MQHSRTQHIITLTDACTQSHHQGDRVLTTDQEHAGGLAGWRHFVTQQPVLASLDMVAISMAPPPTTEVEVLALFSAALKSHKYAVFR
jgi:hypothetical protein